MRIGIVFGVATIAALMAACSGPERQRTTAAPSGAAISASATPAGTMVAGGPQRDVIDEFADRRARAMRR